MEAIWEMYDGDTLRISWNFEQTTISTQWFAAFDNSAPFGGEEWDWSLSDFGKEGVDPVDPVNPVDPVDPVVPVVELEIPNYE